MKSLNSYFTGVVLGLSLFSCTSTESGCSSVDECLSSYDFEGARKHIENKFDSDKEVKKITISESKYWADKGEIDRSLTIVDESWDTDDYYWPEADWQQWRYNIIDKGVTSCCEKGNYNQAKIYALKASDDLNVDGVKIGKQIPGWRDRKGNVYSYESDCEDKSGKPCLENTAQGPSMREALLKKITQFEELVK
ncbi:MAG: hypothetical protein FJZ67_12180 [Bacteroidetes bacterium]|nr:hypothetical protein [Bacteroidota bacterium]